VGERRRVAVTLLPLGLAERLLVQVNQQHVFHVYLPPAGYPPAVAPTTGMAQRPSHGVGQQRIGGLVRQVLLASKETHERPPPKGDVLSNRAAQHRIAGLESVEHRPLSNRPFYRDRNLAIHPARVRR
jgi:hypothetical protein